MKILTNKREATVRNTAKVPEQKSDTSTFPTTNSNRMTSKAEIPRNMVVSDEEWGKMKSMISDQIDSVDANINELKDNGSLETIAQMIKRGDNIPSARLQAWCVSSMC